MRTIFSILFSLYIVSINAQTSSNLASLTTEPVKNDEQIVSKDLKLVLVTWDGCRWQETFRGVSKSLQKRLAKEPKFDKELLTKLTAQSKEDRRAALMPFMWNTVSKQGIIVGNKDNGNVLSVRNPYFFSYPGYSELFCGYVDKKVNSNDYPDNPNTNIFDILNNDTFYKNNIAAFGNWEAFTKILNANRSKIPVFHTYLTNHELNISPPKIGFDTFLSTSPVVSNFAEKDTSVYHFAKEYMMRNHPKAMFIGFDETDHFGHTGNYAAYTMAVHQSDVWMQDLWNTIQSDPFYKDQTILVITCDHGRGPALFNLWRHHGVGVPASKHTWLAAMGPGVNAIGEQKSKKHYFQNQIAATIMKLLGKEFGSTNPKIGKPIEDVLGR